MITQDQLDEALYIQQMHIGEILIYGGRITEEQRDHALAVQKKKYRLYGKILIDLGYSTKEDVRWALREMNKKIGRILRNKGLITDYDMTCALSLKTCRMDSEGNIISFG